MGLEVGFEIDPPLSKGIADRQSWALVVDAVEKLYEDDPRVDVCPNYIRFKLEEQPRLPLEGHKLRRFSIKVSSSDREQVGDYVEAVARVARRYLGDRIRPWNDGIYDRDTVNQSVASYDKPDEPEIPDRQGRFPNGTDPGKEYGVPLFKVQDVPGKGKGLVARFDISTGTRILREKPLLTLGPVLVGSTQDAAVIKLIRELPRGKQQQFLSLHNSFRGTLGVFEGIFRTNAMPSGSSGSGSVFAEACRINHSCLPNSNHFWNSNLGEETIHAIRPIPAGEEVTISYGNHNSPSAVRRARLKQHFGFDCCCERCRVRQPELAAVDALYIQMARLDEDIARAAVGNKPEESLRSCRALLRMLDRQYQGSAYPLVARAYYDAFEVCVGHADLARAKVFATRSYEARLVCEGGDSPDTHHARDFMLKPDRHPIAGICSARWRSKATEIPKGLDEEQFEKWLFKDGN